jgi:hypothetical protein
MYNFKKHARNFFYSLYDLKKLDEDSQNADGPIVSLTTVPQRINLIKPTLISLLRQKTKPKRIEINLGTDLFQGVEIPTYLQNMKTIKVYWQTIDYGPATKLISTLERYQTHSEKIVVVDDDMYYSENLITDLMAADIKSNGQQVFCINGFLIGRDLKSESAVTDRILSSGCKKVAIVEGCGGYILRSYHLDCNSLLNLEHAPARAFFDDDVWISGHLSKAGIEKIQITTGKRKSLVNTTVPAIDNTTSNRSQLRTDIMHYFATDWKHDEFELQ